MFKKRIDTITLHYVYFYENSYGSMTESDPHLKEVKCNRTNLFSAYYYQNLGRDMRKSVNVIVSRYLSNDITVNGYNAKLIRATYNGEKYTITNISDDKTQDRVVILELEEMT